MKNKQNYVQAAIMTVMWAVAMLIAFPIEEYAQVFALILSVCGMSVASYNYLRLIDKVRSGEITIEDLLTRR